MSSSRTISSARQSAERNGRSAEWLSIGLLWLRGYRILARRWRGPAGEIDIVAVRGARLAFIEVKYRAGHGETLIASRQCRRLYATADAFVARYSRYAQHARCFDAVFVAPGTWPRFAPDHLRPLVSGR